MSCVMLVQLIIVDELCCCCCCVCLGYSGCYIFYLKSDITTDDQPR